MALTCKVCTHPRRGVIESLLQYGEQMQTILRTLPTLQKTDLQRHRADCMPEEETIAYAKPTALLAELQEYKRTGERLFEMAVTGQGLEEPKPELAARLLGQLTPVIRQQLELVREIEERTKKKAEDVKMLEQVIVQMVTQHPELREEFQQLLTQQRIGVEEKP